MDGHGAAHEPGTAPTPAHDAELTTVAPPAGNRRRVATGVVAAMLVAGSGGLGFGLGRSLSGDDGGDSVPAADTPPAAAGTLAQASTEPVATAAPTTVLDEFVTETTAPAADGGQVTAQIVEGMSAFEPLDLVWEGRTLDGLRLRLQTGSPYEDAYFEVGGWLPAAFCYGGEQMRLTIDGPDVVDVAYGSWFTELYGSAEVAFVGDLGVADGRPLRVAVVQAADDVVSVTVEYDDGTSATAPVDSGVAVLVADSVSTFTGMFDLTLEFADRTTESLQGGYQSHDSDPVWRKACTPPPPALPPAGEQPADPVAARAEVEARFALLWDRSIDTADKPVLLDDDTGVDEATASVLEGGFAEAAESARFAIEDFVFTSPTQAWFRYGIDTSNGYFGDRFGVAKLTGDGWIFPRAIVCQDLALAGGQCDPPAESILPPSWYEINGEQCVYAPTSPEGDCFTYDESAIANW